jgi:hypothetical protein
LVLLVAVLVLAGCSQNLGPKNYNEEVRTNYMENCVKGATDKLGEAGAATYCKCTYDAISGTISFDRFKDFEKDLRERVGDDINSEQDLETEHRDIYNLYKGCVTQGPTPAGSSASTTVPTSTAPR